MPDVEINGRQVTVERFTVSKGMRVMTLLGLIQKEVPEISRSWADFRRQYAEDYPTRVPRLTAIGRFGLTEIPDEEWERAGQVFLLPGQPNSYETFFHLAPLIYEQAEELLLRLIGLIAMPNDTVKLYVKDGSIWERVDELVQDLVVDAPIEDVMELLVATAEVIDGSILQKARQLSERAGNVARLLGWKTTSTDPETSSESPVQPNTVSAGSSPTDMDGTQSESSSSPTTSSGTSLSSIATGS
jgi:hypothetical protein